MSDYLESLGSKIWAICVDKTYIVEDAIFTNLQISQHETKCKARYALFVSLSCVEFDRVSDLPTASDIWAQL